ncbi:unnamed protein product [Effrenium voratum]|uniref:Uncharacterized protein n=1 Tax=Effrenium voratum TaxID=2562239 RepID=A0AA36IMT7_9DINO|nr:unnamed protein product [Effrenium voratum]
MDLANEDLSSLSESELQSYVEALRSAFEQRGLEWPTPVKTAPVQARRPAANDDDDDDEEDEDEDEDEEGEDREGIASLEKSVDKVLFDFRLGELPSGVEHEGQPARLMRTADSGDATVLSVPAGGYLRLPLDFPEKHGATVGQYTLIVELRTSHPRPLSLFQATWPEVSANHATISECILDEARVLVGGAESDHVVKSLASARQQNRFVRVFFVCDSVEGQISVYVNSETGLTVGNIQGTRWALDRKGLLLLASNSATYMPGAELKRVELHRRLFTEKDVKAHASVRWSFRGAALSAALKTLRGRLALAAIDKKPQPIWCDLSYLAHFCDVYMNIDNGKIYRSLQVIHLGLSKLAAEKHSLMTSADQDALNKVFGVFDAGLDLFRKYDMTRGEVDYYDDYAELPGLLPFLKRLRRALGGLEVGGMVLLPGGWGCADYMPRQYISFVLERIGEDNYRIAVFGFGDSREYHPKTASMHPKVKFRPVVLENLPRKKALDEAWWALLLAMNLPDVNEQKTNPQLTYDFFLPYMAGQTLEKIREESEKREGDDPALDWRTPVYGRSRNNFHRCLLDALHYCLRRSGLSQPRTKLVKFCLRSSLLELAAGDVKAVLEMSGSDRTLVRMLCKQLAFTAAKLSNLKENGRQLLGLEALAQVRRTVDEVETKLGQKTSSEGSSLKPPLLDLCTGHEISHVALGKAKAPLSCDGGSGIFPLFERLLREELEGKEGSMLDTSQLPPVNFDLLSGRVTSMGEAVTALKTTDFLLAQLDNLSSSLRFAHFLKIALVQHVFTRLLPVPLGPISRARAANADAVWGGITPPEQQVEVALVVKRIAQHFAMSCGATTAHRGFDGTRVIVLAVMVTLMDRLLRQTTTATTSRAVSGRMDDEREETRFMVSWEVFAKQSETFLLFSPDLNVARARTLAYFQEVEQEAREQGAKMKHIFQWERDGWVMEFPDQGAEALCGKMAKSLYKRRTTLIDSYVESYFPEFTAYRDVCMWWKFYLCTDPMVFRFQALEFSDGHLQWKIDTHPRWRKRCYMVKSFGQGNRATLLFQKMEKPAMKEHRFQSEALPSNLAGQSIWSEDDVLHVHTMPSFEDRLGQADSELLLSYLTVPYLRLPLCLGFFSSEDRVHALSQSRLRDVLQAVVFEPGRFLPSRLYGQVPQLVPAEDPELLGTAFGLLTNELARSPEATIDAVLQLLEQALRLDTQDPHATTTTLILSVLQLCCRVQNTLAFLLSVSRAEHPSCSSEGLNEGGRPVLSEQTLRQLQAAWPRLRAALQFDGRSALAMLGRWLGTIRTDFGEKMMEEQGRDKDEEGADLVIRGAGEERVNGEYICRFKGDICCYYEKIGDDSCGIDNFHSQWFIFSRYDGVCYEASGGMGNVPKIWKAVRGKLPLPIVESVVDRETHLACQLHAHRVLLLRNLRPEELTLDLVESLLCSFVFLTSRHTWNEDTLGMPEPELFEVIFAKRLELIAWLEEAPYGDACRVLNAVLRTATGIEKGPPGWAIWPEVANRGRYLALNEPLPSTDNRLPMAGSFGDSAPAAEVNLQSLVFRVEGQQMQALDERAAQDRDVLHIFGSAAKTMQCVSLGDFEHRQDRKVVGTDYVISMWDGENGGLPEIGLCDRVYDPDDLAPEEQWIADFFEPIRKKYFTKLGMPPADVPFYLPEQTVPEDAHMVLLAGGHPKKTSVIWKEVVIYKDFGACHVFGIEACGRRKYRTLEMATDCRFCHWELQPDSRLPGYDDMQFQRNPMEPWPAWGRHLAVAFTSALDDDEEDYRDWLRGVQPPPFGPSVVIQRPVQSVRGKPTLSAEEAEARVKAAEKPEDARAPPARKGAWDRPAVKDMEEYIPSYLLRGLIPAALLASYDFWQDTGDSCRLIGYGKGEVLVELLPRATILGVGMEGPFDTTDEPAACARITLELANSKGDLEPHLLLNLLSAPKGTPLHSVALWAARLDDLSHVLAWGSCAEADQTKPNWACAPMKILQFPRLGLTFFVKEDPNSGEEPKRLVSADFGNLSVPLAPVPEQVAKLLTGIPHSVILCDELQALHVLVPQNLPMRPNLRGRPFTTEIVFERLGKWGKKWASKAKVTYFKYEVHVSKGFLIAPSFSSAMYLLLLRFLARDYGGVCSLVHAVGTDAPLNEEEAQILQVLGLVEDAHPDALACRCLVTLAVQRSGCPLHWDFRQEFAWYASKISHISARSRLSLEQEAELLEECDRLNSKYRVVEAQTKKVPARERNQILALFLDPEDAKAAAASEMQKLQDLKSGILSGMRAEGLSCNEVEMRRLVGTIQERRHELPAWMKHCLENRQELLKARGYKISEKDDGKKKDKDKNEKAKEVKDEVTLKVPKPTDDARAKWIVHCNRNVLKDSMVSSASLEECNTKTYATRPALEWALLNLHGDVSLDEMFVLLYRLFTGQTKLKMGPPGSTEEDTRRWAHTYATLVAYMQPEALEGGFLASFLNVFAHNFDEVLVDPNMPKPPGNDAYRSGSRDVANERFLTELRSWVLSKKDRLVWPSGGDDEAGSDSEGDGDDDDDEDDNDDDNEDDNEDEAEDKDEEKAEAEGEEKDKDKEGEEEEEDFSETFKCKVVLSSKAEVSELVPRLEGASLSSQVLGLPAKSTLQLRAAALRAAFASRPSMQKDR